MPEDIPASKVDEINQLILLLRQPDRGVKIGAIRKIGAHKSEKARDALTRLTRDQDYFVRREAGEALAKMGDFRILAEWLGDKDHDVSYNAAESLVKCGGLEAIPILIEGLKHETAWDASIWGIIIPLLEYNESRFEENELREALRPAVPILISWLEKTMYIPKSSLPLCLQASRAVEALGKIGDVSALPVLENLLIKINKVLGGEIVKEYVVTSMATGYVSSDSSIKRIQDAIENIKRNYNALKAKKDLNEETTNRQYRTNEQPKVIRRYRLMLCTDQRCLGQLNPDGRCRGCGKISLAMSILPELECRYCNKKYCIGHDAVLVPIRDAMEDFLNKLNRISDSGTDLVQSADCKILSISSNNELSQSIVRVVESIKSGISRKWKCNSCGEVQLYDKQSASLICQCEGCGQRLRVPATSKTIIVTCISCKFRFLLQ